MPELAGPDRRLPRPDDLQALQRAVSVAAMLRTLSSTRSLGLVMVFLLVAVSCRKEKSATTPDDAAAAKQTNGVLLRYGKKKHVLTQTTNYEVTVSGGGQFGALKARVGGTVNVEPLAEGALKVSWKIDAVDGLELKGFMEPKAKEGEAPPDPNKVLVEHGVGAFVMDLRGETDDEKTKALPENAEKAKAVESSEDGAGDEDATPKAGDEEKVADPATARRQLVALFESIFLMPGLPEEALEIGKSVTREKEEEIPLSEGGAGPMLPVESETIYKLVRIDDASGVRIAELSVETEASGATEFQGGMLVVDQSTEGTLLFNLDEGVPVSLNTTSTQSYALGEQGQEIVSIVRSEFSAPAAAAR